MSAVVPRPAAALPSQEAVLAQAEHENFPVAGILLGRRRRMQLMAIYGFARLVDDVGDEVDGDRGRLLDQIEGQLDQIYSGRRPEHPVMGTLADAVWAGHLPASPFRRLIAANRRDQVVHRYETFDELIDYCQLSAAPVGELVLHVFHRATPDRIALSDRICAGLQVTEHLQDVAEDHSRGRIYLPAQDLTRFQCSEADVAAAAPTPAWRALMAFQIQRAAGLLSEGAPLARTLPPRPRMAVAGFVAGGRRALDALHRDLAGRPQRSAQTFARGFLEAVMGR